MEVLPPTLIPERLASVDERADAGDPFKDVDVSRSILASLSFSLIRKVTPNDFRI